MDNKQQYNQTDKYDRMDLDVPLSSNEELDPDYYGDAGLFDVPGIARKMRPENSLQQAEPRLAEQSYQSQQVKQQNSRQPQAGPPLGPPLGPQGRSQAGSLTDENENGYNDQTVQQEAETIRQFGETQLPQSKSNIHVLSIVGEIEGHIVLPPQNKTTKYEHIIPQLVALEQDDEIEGTIILLNTVGGDVEAGLAIAEMIASMSKPTVSIVLGGGHSIGVPIAVAADYSFITDTASMTVHPIRLNGMVIGVPQTYEYLDKMQDRVVSFVVNHSNISEKTFRELMFRTGELARDIGTVLIGQEAVQTGLIDDVGGLGSAVAMLRQLIARQREAGVYQ